MILLFVDDHKDILEIYKAEMEYELKETECHYAISGEEALKICEEHAITHVFTDAKMPGIDGIELTREVMKRWPDKKVYMVSGYEGKYTDEELKEAGVLKFFQKPIDFDSFIDFIKALS